LVIDEISMLSGALLDTLDCIARACCNSRLPFGGLQLVACGDFFQLPPVEARTLAFESRAWAQVSAPGSCISNGSSFDCCCCCWRCRCWSWCRGAGATAAAPS
jgi:hypothetical protein